jgi:hypothetical protein
MAFIRNDRFGNPSVLKLAKPVVNKKTGEEMPIFRCYVEIGSCLYRIDVSESRKEGRPGMWIKVTKQARNRQSGGFGGSYQGQGRGGSL